VFLAVATALDNARPYVVALGPPESPRALVVARRSNRRATYRLGYLTFSTPLLRCLDVVYEGLLPDGQPESLRMAIDYLAARLARGGVDLVSFNHLRSEQAEQMAAVAPRAVFDRPELHRRFELVPGSYEQTISGFSKKHRYNMRRADRLFVERLGGDVRLRVFTQEQELDQFFSPAARITARTYQGGLNVGLVDNSVTRALLSAEASAGRLRCYWLEAKGEPIAHQVGCVHGDTYYLAATSFLPQYSELSPGQVLLVRVIEDLCTTNVRWIDYGFGDAEYKRIYGTEFWMEQSVRLYGRTPRATAVWAMDLAVTRGVAWLHAIADRLGVVRRLKNAWRRRVTRNGA
jgi:CelD/BcsL family acetyltransferase involved in cellulose biosynthesis